MQTLKLPTKLGASEIQQILIFSKNKALLLGEYLDTGNDDAGDMWCYFNPITGELISEE